MANRLAVIAVRARHAGASTAPGSDAAGIAAAGDALDRDGGEVVGRPYLVLAPLKRLQRWSSRGGELLDQGDPAHCQPSSPSSLESPQTDPAVASTCSANGTSLGDSP